MLNYLWGGMLILGVIYGALTGNICEVSDAMLNSAGEAIELCFTMGGVMAFWVGIMKIAENAGILKGLTNVIRPVIHYLFPMVPEGHRAQDYIAANVIANILGLGWAATPAGLKAMEALGELKEERNEVDREEASVEMCDFLILNISSLQLIPVTIIAYRSKYGSPEPTAIIAPAIIATLISTLTAVLFLRIRGRIGNRRN